MSRTSLSRSFRCAFSGIGYVVRTQRNARIHLAAAVLVAVLGIVLHVSYMAWAVLALTVGSVLALEMVNTALEAVVDLVAPDMQPVAKAAKDAAAGAVLVMALTSLGVGLAIFGPAL